MQQPKQQIVKPGDRINLTAIGAFMCQCHAIYAHISESSVGIVTRKLGGVWYAQFGDDEVCIGNHDFRVHQIEHDSASRVEAS